MDFLRGGLHIYATKPASDELLLKLKPQWIVVVCSTEHADAIAKGAALVAHYRALLPGTVIGVRWWDDNKIALKLIRQHGSVAAAVDAYVSAFFKLAIPGTWLMVGNEEDASASDPTIFAQVCQLHAGVLRRANAAGIALGYCCTAMGEPLEPQYALLEDVFRAAQEGLVLGLYHIWRPNAYFPNSKLNPDEQVSLRYHLTQRHQREGRAVAAKAGLRAPLMALGEFNTVVSLQNNLEGPNAIPGYDSPQWMDDLLAGGVDVPYAVFCWRDGLYDSNWITFDMSIFDGAVEQMQHRLPRTPDTMIEEWKRKTMSVKQYMPRKVCPHVATNAGKLVGLGEGEVVQCRLNGQGIVEQLKNAQRESFFVTGDSDGGGFIYRIDDTSELWTPDGLQHGTFSVQYSADPRGKTEAERLAIMGCKWLPNWFGKGDKHTRVCWLAVYRWDGTLLNVDKQTTVIECLEVYETYAIPGTGIVLKNVVVLLWGGEETYYYADDWGLVQWLNLRSGGRSYLAKVGDVAVMAPAQIPLARPTVAPPPAYPASTTPPPSTGMTPAQAAANPGAFGELLPGVVESMPLNSANLREQPDTSSRIVGQVIVDDALAYRPVLYPINGTNDGYQWRSVRRSGVDSWLFNGVQVRPGTLEQWLGELPLPFVSQTDVNADLDVNDCLLAVDLMLAFLHHVQAFGKVPQSPTVDDLVPWTRLAGPGTSPLNFTDGAAVAARLGFEQVLRRPLQGPQIVAQLTRGRAVGCLVDRGVLYPGAPHIPHFIAVYGYSETRFKYHDPYNQPANTGGPGRDVHRATLDAAMQTVPQNALSYQGFTLEP